MEHRNWTPSTPRTILRFFLNAFSHMGHFYLSKNWHRSTAFAIEASKSRLGLLLWLFLAIPGYLEAHFLPNLVNISASVVLEPVHQENQAFNLNNPKGNPGHWPLIKFITNWCWSCHIKANSVLHVTLIWNPQPTQLTLSVPYLRKGNCLTHHGSVLCKRWMLHSMYGLDLTSKMW